MLSSEDPRWKTLMGGYRMHFDPRPVIGRLENSPSDADAWGELIEEVYHQGDVGDASYVAVALLAQSDTITRTLSWQLPTLVAYIELARTVSSNPPVPDWLWPDYFGALARLGSLCLKEMENAQDPVLLRSMLSIVTLQKRLRVYASALINYSEDELKDFLPQ